MLFPKRTLIPVNILINHAMPFFSVKIPCINEHKKKRKKKNEHKHKTIIVWLEIRYPGKATTLVWLGCQESCS